MDPLRAEDETGLTLSSGSRCSCFGSDDRCLFIFLIILWLNHFVSVVIKNVLMARARVGGVAGTDAVPARGGVWGRVLYVRVTFPICTGDVSFGDPSSTRSPKRIWCATGQAGFSAVACNFSLPRGFERPKSQGSSRGVISARASGEMVSCCFTHGSSKGLFMH